MSMNRLHIFSLFYSIIFEHVLMNLKFFKNCSLLFTLIKYIWVYENRASEMIFLVSKNFFARTLISKMAVKMNLRLNLITKNHAADPEIEFLTKSISKLDGCATAMPTAWELKKIVYEG